MEEWQKTHITRNLKQLIKLTIFNSLLKADLQAKEILSTADVEKLGAEQKQNGDLEASSYGYKILPTREGAYKVLYDALKDNNQSGAYTILARVPNDLFSKPLTYLGISTELKTFLHVVIEVQGKNFKLNEFFRAIDYEKLQQIFQNCLTELEIYDIFHTKERKFILANSSIRPKPSYYVPRFLSNRVKIDEFVFKSKCNDVFVFTNTIKRHKLSQIAQPNSTFKSSSQIHNITCRFIYLDYDEHWNKLKNSAKVPIHLINYEADQDVYLLEDTSATSDILRKLGSREERVYMSEEEFVLQQLSEDCKSSSVCICDTPGMGKTFLLENIARSMADKCAGRIVVFIQLSSFASAFCQDSTNLDFEPEKSLINVLSEIFSPRSNQSLLLTLVKAEMLRVDIFFDGFDEISNDKVEWMKQVFRSITSNFPKVRIYITSRPHMRQELEQSLGVVAYDILPFKKENQVDFFVQFWQSSKLDLDHVSLQDYATSCLNSVNESLTKNDKEIAGIPLLCMLIAEVYSDKDAFRSIKTEGLNDVPLQISEMYQIFIMKKIKLVSKDKNEFDNIKNVHIWHALKLLFPTNGFHEDKLFKTVNESPTSSKMLTGGILQKQSNGTLEFIHRTFAEFLVADYFCAELKETQKTEEMNSNSMSILELLLICQNTKEQYGNHHRYKFLYSVIVSFFNPALVKNDISKELKMRGAEFVSSISHEKFIGILCACCQHNSVNLFCLLTQSLAKWDNSRVQECFSDENCYDLLRVCIKESNSQLFQKCIQLLAEELELDLKQINTYVEYYTLLQWAVVHANYEAVEYFAERISLKNQSLLEKCVQVSYENDDIEKRGEILNLLQNKDSTLIDETPHILLTIQIDVTLLKILVELGANLNENDYGNNCAMHAAVYMSSTDYHELVKFLLNDCKAEYLFLGKEKCQHPLLNIIERVTLLSETLDLIFNISGVDINMKDKFGENLLFHAARGNKVENFKKLLDRGLDYNVRGKWKRSLLHVAATTGEVEMVRHLLSLKVDANSCDENGWTPLHHAAGRFYLSEVEVLVKNGANVHAKNNSGQTALHISVNIYSPNNEVIKYLIGKGAQVNDRDNEGNTALHLCEKGHVKGCLIEMGADIHAKNIKGQTPAQKNPKLWK